MLFQITAPHFTAGLLLSDRYPQGLQAWNVAPIIKYMYGWDLEHISEYCIKKGWELTQI